MAGELVYATTVRYNNIDRQGRPVVRHLMPDLTDQDSVREWESGRTLCGRVAVEVFDWSTPLLTTCKHCLVQARTRDARVRR